MGTMFSQSDAPDQHFASVVSDTGSQGNKRLFMVTTAALAVVVTSVQDAATFPYYSWV